VSVPREGHEDVEIVSNTMVRIRFGGSSWIGE
jgi:hypothetical protein